MSLARRTLQIVAFICTLIVGVTSMAVIVTQTTWFKEWLRGFIVRQAADYVNGRLSIGRLDGNLLFGVELEDVNVVMDGTQVVAIKDVGLDYNAFTFVGGHVVLDDIRLNQPTLRLEKTADGWNITRLIRARTPDPDERAGRPLEIGEIGVTDAALYFDQPVGTTGVEVPQRIEKLNASIGLRTDEHLLDVRIGHVSLRAQEPRLTLADFSGRIVRTRHDVHIENLAIRTEESSLRIHGAVKGLDGRVPVLQLSASSDKLALDEIGRLVPELRGLALQPAFEASATGPLDHLDVDLTVREATAGAVKGDLTVDAQAPRRRVAGTIRMDHLNVGPLARNATLRSDITGQARLDLALPSGRFPLSGTYAIDAARVEVAGYDARHVTARGRLDGRRIQLDASAAVYRGRATAAGTIAIGPPLAVELRGEASGVDLRNLPPQLNAPGVPSNLRFEYRLSGRDRAFSGDVRLAESTLAGATIAPGTTASVAIGSGAPRWAAQGSVRALDLHAVGQGFGIDALAADRFRSRLNATFTVKGSGGGSAPLALEASATATDSEVFGARIPGMDVAATIAGPDLRVRARGEVAELDPAIISGNERAAGDVAGVVDIEATLRNYREGVAADGIDARGRIELAQSTIADLAIESAVIDGAYADQVGRLTQLSVEGPDLRLRGQGTLALTPSGASDLDVHMESPALEKVGTLIDRPLKGAVLVDAEITGNRGALKAAGSLRGSNLGYGDHEALHVESTFAVTVPDLEPARASIQADSKATFLEIAGQRITELSADTTYTEKRLDFTAAAKEGLRELDAGGAVIFHPDHQEIHLQDLTLRTEDIEWRSAPGSHAAVQYGKERIEVEDFVLVNGGQRIEAEGAIGSTAESLNLRVANVDVAQLDRLLLANSGMGGRLNVTAALSGPADALRANGSFTLTEGAFRNFTFESLTGGVKYGGPGMQVDLRLQQAPAAWLTAKGYVPIALFRPSGAEAGGHVAPAPGETIDLEVSSSEIDLGVVQGFTSYVTDVTGALQANVTVTGSAHDPHLTGGIDIRGGALTIPDLGTAYTGIDTRIDLTPDAVSIREMRMLDEHGKALTVGGTLAVHEREVGTVDVTIASEDFEVIDNELADLKLDTDLRLTGELRAPRIVGTIEVESGTIDVAEILKRTTSDPYATEATELAGPAAPEGQAGAPPEPSLFDGLDLNVSVSVPSNLVVRGSDVRPANAPISIGDITVTVGGLMQVRKPRGSGDLRLLGEVNTVRGTYRFQGRRFELMRDGRIRFAGADEINPLLDLRARRVISGVETFVRVQGTLREPELSFSSNPPLEEADILSLIVFNAPVNELGEGQQASLAERAGALAGGYLASGLARSIGTALELDEFEIQAQGENGAGPTLTIGEQVGERLFFRIRQGFGAAQATEFILEYQIAEYLRLQGAVAETAGSDRVMFRRIERAGLDLIFFFSY